MIYVRVCVSLCVCVCVCVCVSWGQDGECASEEVRLCNVCLYVCMYVGFMCMLYVYASGCVFVCMFHVDVCLHVCI